MSIITTEEMILAYLRAYCEDGRPALVMPREYKNLGHDYASMAFIVAAHLHKRHLDMPWKEESLVKDYVRLALIKSRRWIWLICPFSRAISLLHKTEFLNQYVDVQFPSAIGNDFWKLLPDRDNVLRRKVLFYLQKN